MVVKKYVKIGSAWNVKIMLKIFSQICLWLRCFFS